MRALRRLIKGLLASQGLEIRRLEPPPSPPVVPEIPDGQLYQPVFSPWLGEGAFRRYYEIARPKTLVSADRCYVLLTLLEQALRVPGDVWECGVYKGGTAAMMAAFLEEHRAAGRLYLFDTFAGMPETDAEKDWHRKGDFADTSLETVTQYVGHAERCVFRPGFLPETFEGLGAARIAFAHIDVDIYRSILDSLNFIWPRLSGGGFMVFDDYGFPTCPGARRAVDEFFQGKGSVPLCLPTGQALVFKGC